MVIKPRSIDNSRILFFPCGVHGPLPLHELATWLPCADDMEAAHELFAEAIEYQDRAIEYQDRAIAGFQRIPETRNDKFS